jgi:futalosine hydrolase
MKILLVAATGAEIHQVCSAFGADIPATVGHGVVATGKMGAHKATVLVTGVGMVNSAWMLGQITATVRYDLMVNLGVCGSFNRSLELGTVVQIVEDAYSELGAEDPQAGFLDLKGMGLTNFKVGGHVYHNGVLNPAPANTIHLQCKGITVNTVHGQGDSIETAIARWQPEVETMESAAFMQCALQIGVPFYCFRGISNYVEPRNRAAWKLAEAAAAAQNAVVELVTGLPA